LEAELEGGVGLSEAALAWAALDGPWRACLSLAREAYGSGTIPVGAVLADGSGSIVSEGA
jgi:hypothetical protein